MKRKKKLAWYKKANVTIKLDCCKKHTKLWYLSQIFSKLLLIYLEFISEILLLFCMLNHHSSIPLQKKERRQKSISLHYYNWLALLIISPFYFSKEKQWKRYIMEKFSKYWIKEQISKYFLTFLKQRTAPKTSELDQ